MFEGIVSLGGINPKLCPVKSGLMFVALFILLAPLASADEWRFEIAPYYWAAKQKGDVIQQQSVSVEVGGETRVFDLDSTLDSNTESVGLVALSASKGDWLLWTEAYSVESDNGESGIWMKTDVTAKQTFWDIDLAYRFLHDDELDLYVYGGLRMAEVDGQIDLTAIEGEYARSFDVGEDWVDPIIGIQSRWQLSETWAYWASLEAAGFGLGSDKSWQLVLAVDQKLTSNVSMRYAYRFASVNYDDNDFVYDVSVSGLMIGIGFGF